MQPWPALITESPQSFEQHVQRGREFHRLAQQMSLGLDRQRLAATIHDLELSRWWQTLLASPPAGLPETVRRAEAVVAAPLAAHRLVAKFDLLAISPGQRLVVVDWKTVHQRPSRVVLAQRLQTRVYRLLGVEACAALNGGRRPRPEQVEMVYWFAQHGGATERFDYDASRHAADQDYLGSLVAEIASQQGSVWPLTSEERNCRYCNYRSLCERGVRAGFLDDLDEDLEPLDFEIDLEQVAEVIF
jgi:hypothetical protein